MHLGKRLIEPGNGIGTELSGGVRDPRTVCDARIGNARDGFRAGVTRGREKSPQNQGDRASEARDEGCRLLFDVAIVKVCQSLRKTLMQRPTSYVGP